MMDFIAYLNSSEGRAELATDRFLLILLVIVLTSFKRAAYKSMWLAVLINLPGTVLHECAHFVVGILLNAKPVSFSLFPKKVDDHYVTGQVGFSNLKFYNALPVSMAPLLLLFAAYFVNKHMFDLVPLNFATYLIHIFLLTILIENAIPSRMDFYQGFRRVLGLILYGAIFMVMVVAYSQ